MKPISPSDVVAAKKEKIPEVVIETFNDLIAQNFLDGVSSFKQKAVVLFLVEKGLNRQEIYDKHWLDIEDVYREAGWKVVYDKPAYNETYEPNFTFSVKPKE